MYTLIIEEVFAIGFQEVASTPTLVYFLCCLTNFADQISRNSSGWVQNTNVRQKSARRPHITILQTESNRADRAGPKLSMYPTSAHCAHIPLAWEMCSVRLGRMGRVSVARQELHTGNKVVFIVV